MADVSNSSEVMVRTERIVCHLSEQQAVGVSSSLFGGAREALT